MASNYTNPINILDSHNATGIGSGGSLNVEGGASIKQDMFIGGNISISGTTTSFSDNILLINKNPSVSTDTGIIFQRYTSDIQNNDNYAGIIYSEQNDAFNLGYLVSDADRNYVSMGNLVSLNTKEITTGNLNFTGNLYKNGTLYNPGTQWTTTNSDISYTSGNVNTSNLITTDISGSNMRLSGDLYVGGTLSVVNVTTTNVVDINISTGTITVSNLSNFANVIATNISTGTINATVYTGGSMQLSGSVTVGTLRLTSTNIALGASAGNTSQSEWGIAIGRNSGNTSQGSSAVAIGAQAGQTLQGGQAVAIGNNTGTTSQGSSSTAIGPNCATNAQGANSVAVGTNSGNRQGIYAVAIGALAGGVSQGNYAVAIGSEAGRTSQHSNSIIINANSSALNSGTAGAFYVNPVRNVVEDNFLGYDAVTKEITYWSTSNFTTTNLVATNISTGTLIASTGITTGTLLATTIVGSTSISSASIQGTNSTITNAVHTALSTGTLNLTSAIVSTGITTATLLASTSISSGIINATNSTITNVVATTLTSGNIYFTGNLYKNGVLFAGTSQWSNGAGTIHYTSGNVGIGRINPEYTLDVTGNARVTATSQNTATGGVTLITLERPGVSGTTYPSYVDFNVHRYSQVSSDAWTQLDLNLSNGQSVGRTNVMTLRGNGNVGIGTTAPGYKLDVVGSANFTANLLATNISGGNISAGNLTVGTFNTAKMNVSHTSNNLITGGIALLTLNRPGAVNQAYDSSVDFNIHRYSNVNYAAFTQLDINLTNGLSSDRTNVMTLRGNGNVGIGTTAPAYQLHLSSDSAAKPSTNTWTISSDSRLKTNITMANLDICYDNVKNIPLKRYTWRDDIYTTDQVHDRSKLGWIAQDVETFIPKAVEQKEMHGYSDCRSLNSDQIIASLYGSVQKLIQDFENETAQHNITKQAFDNLKTELQNKFPGEFN
jgi:hypothetical protein